MTTVEQVAAQLIPAESLRQRVIDYYATWQQLKSSDLAILINTCLVAAQLNDQECLDQHYEYLLWNGSTDIGTNFYTECTLTRYPHLKDAPVHNVNLYLFNQNAALRSIIRAFLDAGKYELVEGLVKSHSRAVVRSITFHLVLEVMNKRPVTAEVIDCLNRLTAWMAVNYRDKVPTEKGEYYEHEYCAGQEVLYLYFKYNQEHRTKYAPAGPFSADYYRYGCFVTEEKALYEFTDKIEVATQWMKLPTGYKYLNSSDLSKRDRERPLYQITDIPHYHPTKLPKEVKLSDFTRQHSLVIVPEHVKAPRFSTGAKRRE